MHVHSIYSTDRKWIRIKSRLFSVYIPPQSGEIEVAQHSCACSKIPTAATRDIRRINRDLHKLQIQSVNISIEASRYRENEDSTGNILNILNDKLIAQPLEHANIEKILPLNYTMPNEKLITPATVALFTAKTVGMPLLQKAFEMYFKRFRDTIPSAHFFPLKTLLHLFYLK